MSFDLSHVFDWRNQAVCRYLVTVIDKRTGEMINDRVYLPKNSASYNFAAKKLAIYGYDLVSFDEDETYRGTVVWKEIFRQFKEKERRN